MLIQLQDQQRKLSLQVRQKKNQTFLNKNKRISWSSAKLGTQRHQGRHSELKMVCSFRNSPSLLFMVELQRGNTIGLNEESVLCYNNNVVLRNRYCAKITMSCKAEKEKNITQVKQAHRGRTIAILRCCNLNSNDSGFKLLYFDATPILLQMLN